MKICASSLSATCVAKLPRGMVKKSFCFHAIDLPPISDRPSPATTTQAMLAFDLRGAVGRPLSMAVSVQSSSFCAGPPVTGLV